MTLPKDPFDDSGVVLTVVVELDNRAVSTLLVDSSYLESILDSARGRGRIKLAQVTGLACHIVIEES